MKPLLIVVPFYKNPHLAQTIGRNLLELAEELRGAAVSLCFINDSPDHTELAVQINDAQINLEQANLRTIVLTNEINLGFVKSTNRGLTLAAELGADALLLNSDVILAPGAISELRAVAELDSMIGVVNPRSNNATICSLPFNDRHRPKSFDAAYHHFQLLSRYLPRYQRIPTGVGFCMLIKHNLLVDFGALDEIYSPGYNEENDFCMRINRCGYSVVVANKAFAYHELSSSFGEDERNLHDERNRPVLIGRYPEYDILIKQYLNSAAFKRELLLETVLNRSERGFHVAIDCSHFRAAFNGTYEFGKLLILALAESEDRDFSLKIICDPEVAAFHELASVFPELELVDPEGEEKFDIVIKPAQPFELSTLISMAESSLYNFVVMLDTIALDCGYLSAGSNYAAIWQLTAETQDGLLYISEFSKEQFNKRFKVDPKIPQLATQLSVVGGDPLVKELKRRSNSSFEETLGLNIPGNKPYIFVVGNHYDHKFIQPTLDVLTEQFPEIWFVCLTNIDKQSENTIKLKAGNLSEAQIEELYTGAKAIVFPSHYEGFGFPIVQGLSKNRPVIARKNSLNIQTASRWQGEGKLFLFENKNDLVEIVRGVVEVAAMDLPKELDATEIVSTFESNSSEASFSYDWANFGRELIKFINSAIQKDPLAKQSRKRLERLQIVSDLSNERTDLLRKIEVLNEDNKMLEENWAKEIPILVEMNLKLEREKEILAKSLQLQ